jgi:ubiquinone/menaquinone biosynthesis C-methylase UbiE
MSIEKSLHSYWDSCAKNYTKRVGYDLSDGQKKVWFHVLEEIIGTDERKKVLDVGTGPGFLALLFSEMGHDSTGVDFSQDMLEVAEKRAANSALKCRFIAADAQNLPFEDGCFDVIVNRHLLWTLLEPEKAVREWMRVLKPGGKLVIMDGAWDDDGYTAIDKMKKALGSLLVRVEKKNFKKKKNVESKVLYSHLPYRGADERKIALLMEKAGLERIRTHNIKRLMDEELSTRSFGYRMIYNRKRYIVIAEKG